MSSTLKTGEGITGAGNTGHIDYLSFTLLEETHLESEIEQLFRVPFEAFIEGSGGRNGYRARYTYDKIDLLTEGGSPGMGHNVTLKGAACHKYQPWLRELAAHVFLVGGHFTRCDLAIDDYQGLLSMEDIQRAITGGQVMARSTSVKDFTDYDRKSGMVIGRGAYFGSRKSDVFIRIYDKALEQRVDQHWIRVELELKGCKADAAMRLLQDQEVGAVARGVLTDRLSFRVRGDGVNRSRWPVAPWWLSFLGSVEKLNLVSDGREPAAKEDRMLWFLRNAATFAELVDHCGPEIVPYMYTSGKAKLEQKGGSHQWML